MRSLASLLVSFAILVSVSPVVGQQAVTRDSQAQTILAQYLQSSGGIATINALQDYTASGNVVFDWAGRQVQGNVIVKGRGANQFRMDATTSEGSQTWIVDHLCGSLTTIDGKTASLPPYNLLNAGSLTIPAIGIAATVAAPTTTIRYVGEVTENGHLTYQIRLIPSVGKGLAVIPGLQKPGMIDLFIDSTTYQLISEVEILHDARDATQTYTHELDFSSYQGMNSVLIPLTITEQISSQQTWSINLTSVNFNTGLADADFATSSQ